jgi:hypothetical protein
VVEQGAAPADGLASHLREAKGNRPRQLCGAAFNGWTRVGQNAAKTAESRAVMAPLRPRKYGPEGPKSPQWSAGRRGILCRDVHAGAHEACTVHAG